MKDIEINIPFLADHESIHTDEGENAASGTANFSKPLKATVLNAVKLDQESLNDIVKYTSELGSAIQSMESTNTSLDAITVKVGITNTGRVGLMGNGIQLAVAGEMILTFKLGSS